MPQTHDKHVISDISCTGNDKPSYVAKLQAFDEKFDICVGMVIF